MFSKSTTIPYSDLKAALDAGPSLVLVCGNNAADRLEHTATHLWHGTGTPPVYTYRKSWWVPCTGAEGSGDTLKGIVEYMESVGAVSATFTVSNAAQDQITHSGTTAAVAVQVNSYDNWGEPPEG